MHDFSDLPGPRCARRWLAWDRGDTFLVSVQLQHKQRVSTIQAAMSESIAVCKYCGIVSTGPSARSIINRHIKMRAKRPADKRGHHPGEDDPAYEYEKKMRHFRARSSSEDGKQDRRAASHQKYREKRKDLNSTKIEKAFERLQ